MRSSRRRSTVAAALPALACLLAGLVVLVSARGYLQPGTPYGDDHSSHLAAVWSVSEDLGEGRADFYFPGNNLGVPLFLSYPPLATTLVAALAAPFDDADVATALFKLSIALCWAAMPLAWYLGGRWLGLDRPTAALFGLASIGIVDRDERGLSLASALHTGLYSQNFGMLLLPLALGACFRWIGDGADARLASRAVVLVWLTALAHAVAALVVGIATAVLVCCRLPGTTGRGRGFRAGIVQGAAFLLLGFWLWPLLAHGDLVGGLPWKNEVHQGRPAAEAVGSLLGGRLFDAGRFPWMTLLFLLGVARAKNALDAPLRIWALASFAAFGLLYLGPTTFGDGFRSLPLQDEINVTRYLTGLHLFGALFVAAGAVATADLARAKLVAWTGRAASPLFATIVFAALGGYLAERHDFGSRAFRTFDPDEPAFAALVDHLRERPGTRVAADATLGTTAHFYRDLLPALSGRPHIQSYGMTYHATLATYFTEYFDFSPAECGLYAVGSIVGRDGEAPPAVRRYERTFDDGRHQVYDCPGAEGYFAFVDLPISLEGRPKAARAAIRATLPTYEASALARLLPPGAPTRARSAAHFVVESNGAVPVGLVDAVDRVRARAGEIGERARVLRERTGKTRFEADVQVEDRPAWLVFKWNAFPYWTARVDGRRAPIVHVAPNYSAVSIPPGRHEVHFEYRFPNWAKALGVASLLSGLALAAHGFRRRRPA